MRSWAVRPLPISTIWPRSRAIVIGFRTTLLLASTVATRRPLLSKISAPDGMASDCMLDGSSMRVLAKAPGISSPWALSTTTCMRVVPVWASTARAEASTHALVDLAGIFRDRDLHVGVQLHRRHEVLRNADVQAQLGRCRRSRTAPGPALDSALMSAPTSVLRVVTMPSNGAVMRLKADSTSSRSTAACAALVRACFTARSLVFSSTVWRDTVLAPPSCVPAPGRHRGQLLGGLGAGKRRLGLQELLVEVGRLDLGQELARLHGRADIDVVGLQEAADAGIDRRAGIGLEPARQVERGLVRAGRRADRR